MNRYELDTFAQHYALSPAAIEASLHLTGNRLTLDGWRQFAQPLLKNLGIGAISARVIFME